MIRGKQDHTITENTEAIIVLLRTGLVATGEGNRNNCLHIKLPI